MSNDNAQDWRMGRDSHEETLRLLRELHHQTPLLVFHADPRSDSDRGQLDVNLIQ